MKFHPDKENLLKVPGFIFTYLLLPLTITVALASVFDTKPVESNAVRPFVNKNFAALVAPENLNPLVKGEATMLVEPQDYRALVLDKYFSKYNSPLAGYGSDFVAACDKYGLPSDCTLLPAIAYAETKLCTKSISAKQFNCWGWGGSGDNRIIFKNFPDAIDRISFYMNEGYGLYLKRPDLIVKNYCGGHCEDWASVVKREQRAINNLANQLGLP